MAVRLSDALKAILTPQQAETLIANFGAWKALGEAGEYESKHFGKDGAYTNPKVGGQSYKLRHVHLPPVNDAADLRAWKKQFDRRARKTSDRVLVYADNGNGDFLLIYVLEEPDAHEIARMTNSANRQLMEGMATLAENFIHGIEDGWSAT